MILMDESIFDELQKQNFVQVQFPIAQEILLQAVEAFFKFLQEPVEVKKQINFTIAPEHRRGDVGFKHRDPADHVYNDSKDFFHFHPALFKKHEKFLSENPVVFDFVSKAKPIWELAYETVYSILQVFEKRFAGIVDKVFATENVHILLRFLKYDWQESGKYLAKPHFDAGSFTLAIAESCPGLRIGSSPDNLKLVEHKKDHAIFMLSSNFKQVIHSDEFCPGWHDVIQLDETLIGKPFARWAVVAFFEAHGVKALPRTETHKWYVGSA